jgi:signal transduction histidine kinase
VLGYAELLLAGASDSLSLTQTEDVQTIHRSASRLVDLVTQMLDFSRLDEGHVTLTREAVALTQIVDDVREGVAPQAAAKSLPVRVDVPAHLPPVLGDTRGIHQILLNLVSNAIKFTERGEVRISTELTDGEVAVLVHDTGIGIDSEVLPHIFEAFRQADGGMTRRYEGAGLGLAIARKLAEVMGGRIAVESEFGRGSTFTLYLQRAP